MKKGGLNKSVTVIAGPCSIDNGNVDDIYKISEITVSDKNGKRQDAIFGVRVVGLKSRSSFSKEGRGMGIDYPAFVKNLDILIRERSFENFVDFPSHEIAREFIKNTGKLVATEIMEPLVQLPSLEKKIPREKLLIWNPAVNQLGWSVMAMGDFAKRNDWYIGLKNGKWLGSPEKPDRTETPMEKSWTGLAHYSRYHSGKDSKVILIHRGVEVEDKGDYRSLPVHEAAKRAKLSLGTKLFFDPSHSLGPKLRDNIIDKTVEAMRMKIDPENYLYDGLLIEVGKSETDAGQHITLDELRELCQKIADFRTLNQTSKTK